MSDDKLIQKVQALIAKAEATEFEAERIAFLSKAQQLMDLNMLTDYDLRLKGQAQKLSVIEKQGIPICDTALHLKDSFVSLAVAVSQHCRCRLILNTDWRGATTGTVFGRENDLEYLEMLYTSVRLQAWQKIDPAYDDKLSLAANVVAMKAAGMKWATIAVRCHSIPDESHFDKKDSSWINIYKAECKKLGIQPVGAQPKNYQANFMEAFVIALDDRLYKIRREQESTATQGTMALAIRENTEDLNAAVAAKYPKLGKYHGGPSAKMNGTARMAGAEAGRNANLGVGGRDSVNGRRNELNA